MNGHLAPTNVRSTAAPDVATATVLADTGASRRSPAVAAVATSSPAATW